MRWRKLQGQRLESREDGEFGIWILRKCLFVYVEHNNRLERGLWGRDVWFVTEVIYKLCSVFSNKKWVEPAQPECWSKQFVGSLEAVLTHSKTIGLSRFNRMNNEKKFIGVLNIFCQWVQPAPPDFEKGEFQNQLWWKLGMSALLKG